MKKGIRRACSLVSAALLSAALVGNISAVQLLFTDVAADSWYESAVQTAYDSGWMDGNADGRFSPDGTLTRAMFVTVLGRTAKAEKGSGTTFPDVPADGWYAGYVVWAQAAGIVQGDADGRFRPSDPVTRQEMAAMLYRYIEYKNATLKPADATASFADASSIAAWAQEAVETMRLGGVFLGDSAGRFRPADTATRAEAAATFARFTASLVQSGETPILGAAVATVEQMRTFLLSRNPDVPDTVLEMLPLYLAEGDTEGIRGDIAFCQSCLETGYFSFRDSEVSLEQNNFCGMGVTQKGEMGNSFDTPQLGIRAQIQHLKAYANDEPLVGECVDPRFVRVPRASAPYVEWLGIQENPTGAGWAAGENYGPTILRLLSELLQTNSK